MASIMLVAFALRALIPPGFMPASDRAFSFEICPEGFPADLLANGGPAGASSMDMDSAPAGSIGDAMRSEPVGISTSHGAPLQGAHTHHGNPWHSEHCVFGSACSAGPTPHLLLPADIASFKQPRTVAFASIAGAVRLVHLPQSRAPPAPLS